MRIILGIRVMTTTLALAAIMAGAVEDSAAFFNLLMLRHFTFFLSLEPRVYMVGWLNVVACVRQAPCSCPNRQVMWFASIAARRQYAKRFLSAPSAAQTVM
jgi:hypothetical protein